MNLLLIIYYQGQKVEKQTGRKVWYFSPVIRRKEVKRFAKHWTGPWVIQEVYSPILMKITSSFRGPEKPEVSRVCTIDRVLLFKEGSQSTHTDETDIDLEGDDLDPDEFGESLENVSEESLKEQLRLPDPEDPEESYEGLNSTGETGSPHHHPNQEPDEINDAVNSPEFTEASGAEVTPETLPTNTGSDKTSPSSPLSGQHGGLQHPEGGSQRGSTPLLRVPSQGEGDVIQDLPSVARTEGVKRKKGPAHSPDSFFPQRSRGEDQGEDRGAGAEGQPWGPPGKEDEEAPTVGEWLTHRLQEPRHRLRQILKRAKDPVVPTSTSTPTPSTSSSVVTAGARPREPSSVTRADFWETKDSRPRRAGIVRDREGPQEGQEARRPRRAGVRRPRETDSGDSDSETSLVDPVTGASD